MVKEINVLNIINNRTITIGASGPYVLDHVNWDAPVVDPSTYRVPYQIGESLESVSIRTRKPEIRGYVISDPIENAPGMSIKEYYEKQEESITKNKTLLELAFNVFQDIVIEANGYKLKARPTTPVKYSYQESENNDVLCLFAIEVECYEPLFYRDSKNYALSAVEGMFHFPLTIPEDTGMIFGLISETNISHVINEGQAETGVIITITPTNGSIISPEIRNVYTQEFIKIEATIEQGDTLTISTETGEENVILHDGETGADIVYVGSVSYDSTFFKVPIGESVYTINAEQGTTGNAQVDITITEKYFNFERM